MISTERSDLRDCKVETAKFDGFWKKIMVHCVAYDCLMIVGRPKAFHPTNFKQTTKGISSYKFQADNQRRMQAVTTNDLRASSSKTTQTSSYKAKK